MSLSEYFISIEPLFTNTRNGIYFICQREQISKKYSSSLDERKTKYNVFTSVEVWKLSDLKCLGFFFSFCRKEVNKWHTLRRR